MKIIADTNVLVRVAVGDDPRQARLALAELQAADLVAITVPTLCELTWVLSRSYKLDREDIAQFIRELRNSESVRLDDAAVDAGLAMLDAGGDFADGVIAYAGRWLGGEVFVSFDKSATAKLAKTGMPVRALN